MFAATMEVELWFTLGELPPCDSLEVYQFVIICLGKDIFRVIFPVLML